MSREDASNKAADCSVVETFLDLSALEIRTYQVPPPERAKRREGAWKQAPYVAAVARCGQLYIFQIRSRSRKAWVIDRAGLEVAKENLLSVTALRFKEQKDDWDINVIAAEAAPGVKLSKLKLHLTGQDGRVAQPEARDLP